MTLNPLIVMVCYLIIIFSGFIMGLFRKSLLASCLIASPFFVVYVILASKPFVQLLSFDHYYDYVVIVQLIATPLLFFVILYLIGIFISLAILYLRNKYKKQ